MEEEHKSGSLNRIVISITFVILIVCAWGIYLYMTRVTPVFEEITYEFGKVTLSENVEDYIAASNFMLKKATLDISGVNVNEVGDYIVTCDVRDEHFVYTIHIVDTTAPSITLRGRVGNYGTYQEYSLGDFASANDLSELKRFDLSCVCENGDPVDVFDNSFVPENPGTYVLWFSAEDIYGNVAKRAKIIDVLEAPHFLLLEDRQYQVGSGFEVSDLVYAEDKDGNDLTDRIRIEDDDFDGNVPGSYEVTYSVVDDDGVERRETVTISVGEFEENSLGFDATEENLELLIAHDYFTYEALEDNDDFYKVVELTSPTSFSMKYDNGPDPGTTYGFFSCYLYKITTQYAWFVTNNHCVAWFDEGKVWNLHDFNGNVVQFTPDEIVVNRSQDRDIAIFGLPISGFTMGQLATYKEVLIDWDIYDRTKVNEKLCSNVQEWGSENSEPKDICSAVTLNSLDRTDLGGYRFKYPSVCTNETFIKSGMSGSPLFDYNGYLIATTESIYINGSQYIDAFVRLDDLYTIAKEIGEE